MSFWHCMTLLHVHCEHLISVLGVHHKQHNQSFVFHLLCCNVKKIGNVATVYKLCLYIPLFIIHCCWQWLACAISSTISHLYSIFSVAKLRGLLMPQLFQIWVHTLLHCPLLLAVIGVCHKKHNQSFVFYLLCYKDERILMLQQNMTRNTYLSTVAGSDRCMP